MARLRASVPTTGRPSRRAALDLAAEALADYDRSVDAAARSLGSGRTFPIGDDVLDVVRGVEAIAVDDVRSVWDGMGLNPPPGLGRMARQHDAGVTRVVNRMSRAGREAGLTGREVRDDVAALMRGEVPSEMRQRYGLDLSDVSPLRTMQSDLRRIVVDQSFEAVKEYMRSRLIGLGKDMAHWRTSARHRVRDVCDEIAARGPYSLKRWPARPHPNCGCYPVPVKDEEDDAV